MLAAGISLALTGALMILMNAAHPPAGATTLIVRDRVGIIDGSVTREHHLTRMHLVHRLLKRVHHASAQT